jgi:hypothetical protein
MAPGDHLYIQPRDRGIEQLYRWQCWRLGHNKSPKAKPKSGKKGIRKKAKNGHHPIPKFLGGALKQVLVKLPKNLHKKVHALIAKGLKEEGINLPIGGPMGRRIDWLNHFKNHPGDQKKAFDVVRAASVAIDRETKSKYNLLDAVKNSIKWKDFDKAP